MIRKFFNIGGLALLIAVAQGCGPEAGEVRAPSQDRIDALGEEDPNAVRPEMEASPAPPTPAPPPIGG